MSISIKDIQLIDMGVNHIRIEHSPMMCRNSGYKDPAPMMCRNSGYKDPAPMMCRNSGYKDPIIDGLEFNSSKPVSLVGEEKTDKVA